MLSRATKGAWSEGKFARMVKGANPNKAGLVEKGALVKSLDAALPLRTEPFQALTDEFVRLLHSHQVMITISITSATLQ